VPRRLVPVLAAAVIAVVGLAGLIYGILLATTLAPPSRTVGTVSGSGVPVVDTATGVLDLDGPQVRIQATAASGGPVFLGIARADDVTAYLADVSRTEITRVGDDGALTTVRAGTQTSLPDPSGADIWVLARSGTGTASLTWPDAAGPWRLVVAGSGSGSAPAQITLDWTRSHRSNSAPAVITVGTLLLVGGLVGLLALRARRVRGDDDEGDDPDDALPRHRAPASHRAPATVPTGLRTPAGGSAAGLAGGSGGSDDAATRIIPPVGSRSVSATGPHRNPFVPDPGPASGPSGASGPTGPATGPATGPDPGPASGPTGPGEPEVPA
jgi:hypothetical protein